MATGPQKETGNPSGTTTSKSKQISAAEAYAKQVLLLMDTDKDGKVSKQEWMTFWEAEFDRLDTNHDGKLDVMELTKMRARPYVGK